MGKIANLLKADEAKFDVWEKDLETKWDAVKAAFLNETGEDPSDVAAVIEFEQHLDAGEAFHIDPAQLPVGTTGGGKPAQTP